MPKPKPDRIPLAAARAHWHLRQGLAAPVAAPLPDVVARTGWLRTLGGVEVYLAARARIPGLTRAAMDAASAALDLQVVPAVRGCIYLLPRAHVPFALAFAESIWRKGADKDLAKAGSSWKEVADVADAVLAALGTPLGTDAIRKVVPIRSFGERGKKIGLSSPLPVALRDLEFRGKVVRTLESGRLDTERYLWRRATARAAPAADPAVEIARIFFSALGATTLKHFADWSGLSQTDARVACASLPLVPVAIEGYADDALVLESQRAELSARPTSGRVSLLGFEDNYLAPHGGPGLFTDPAHHGRRVESWGTRKKTTLGAAKHLSNRAVVVDGEIVAFWELDPAAREVVVAPFTKLPKPLAKSIASAAEATAHFLLDEIGHGRSFSLDTDAALSTRAKALRKK